MSKYQKVFINQKGEWLMKEVRKGFANFLLEKKNALFYNKKNIQRVNKLNGKVKEKKILERENAEKIRKQLNSLQIAFKLDKKDEKVFGSVRIEDIIKELSKQEIHLEKKQFPAFPPLSDLGEHLINIKLGEWDNHPLKVQLKVSILKK